MRINKGFLISKSPRVSRGRLEGNRISSGMIANQWRRYMAKRKRSPSWKKGYRGEIMKLLLSIGVISKRGIPLLKGNHRMYVRKIKEMEDERIIEKHRNSGNVTDNLKEFDKRLDEYIGEFKNGYYGHYNRYCRTNADYVTKYGKDKTQFERAVRDSESAMMVYSSGAKVIAEEKPALRLEETKIPKGESLYYRTAEIKDSRAVRSEERILAQTRCNGWLTCPGGEYLVYMIGKKLIRWREVSETGFAGYVSTITEGKKEGGKREVKEGILLAYTDEPYRRMLSFDKQISTNLNIENGHKVMYGITYDTIGRDMLSLMQKKNWKEMLKKTYLSDMKLNTGMKSYVACDALDGDVKVLLYCIPDLVRLKRFISAAMIEGDATRYHIYCFDYQENFIVEVAGEYCEVYTTPFYEYYNTQMDA